MGFSRQEYWSGLPCASPALAGKFFTTSTTWKAHIGAQIARNWNGVLHGICSSSRVCTRPFVRIKKEKVLVAELCPTVCEPMDCSPTLYNVACQSPLSMGFSQAKILEWVAISFSGDLPNPGIKPASPALQADSLPLSLQGSARDDCTMCWILRQAVYY